MERASISRGRDAALARVGTARARRDLGVEWALAMKCAFATALLLAAVVALGGCAHSPTAQDATTESARAVHRALVEQRAAELDAERLRAIEEELTPFEREWGIKVLGIRVTANGYALDFRYLVVDPLKAAPLVQRKFSPVPTVVVERSGAKLGVPFTDKAGSLRSSVTTADQIRRGRAYMALFANPGKHVKAGDRVSVAFGNFRAPDLVVQ